MQNIQLNMHVWLNGLKVKCSILDDEMHCACNLAAIEIQEIYSRHLMLVLLKFHVHALEALEERLY